MSHTNGDSCPHLYINDHPLVLASQCGIFVAFSTRSHIRTDGNNFPNLYTHDLSLSFTHACGILVVPNIHMKYFFLNKAERWTDPHEILSKLF